VTPHSIDHAAASVVHMYQTIGVQVAALKEIGLLADQLAKQLRDGKIAAAQADAFAAVKPVTDAAMWAGIEFRSKVEQAQHALTAANAATLK
jgi:hypothetical protein